MERYILSKVVLMILLISGVSTSSVYTQSSAGMAATIEPRFLIDMPTAGVLEPGSFSADMDLFQDGGMMIRINAGIIPNVSFGISYGANHVVGSEKISANPIPGINIRLRIMDETEVFPAVLIGFDSQGKESYVRETKRFTIKSPGFFVAASKNYDLLGYLSVHGGLNYSLESKDKSNAPNLYAGVEKTIGSNVSILLEYNMALNDARGNAVGRGRGYLNSGLRWSVGKGFTLGFDMKDFFKNRRDRYSVANRTVFLEYIAFF
jgi:hypothetical protein